MCTETLLRVRVCTECAQNCQGSSTNSGHDQVIKNALQAQSSDQDRILDPGRHRRVLGDYPLIRRSTCSNVCLITIATKHRRDVVRCCCDEKPLTDGRGKSCIIKSVL